MNNKLFFSPPILYMNYSSKYLKYKHKYLALKKGGIEMGCN
jgi:hypothetical protein